MTPSQIAALALCVGLVVGATLSLVFVLAIRARGTHREQSSVDIPEGIVEILGALDDAAAVVDTSHFVLASSRAGDALGLSLGRTLINPEMRELIQQARDRAQPVTTTLRIKAPGVSLEERLIVARATILSPRLCLLVTRDVSEQERLDQMRHDFVSNTSHELKTPVGAITLLAEALEMAADDPEQVRNFAGRLSSEARRLASLTTRIMNLSRLQSTDAIAERRIVGVDEILTTALDANTVQAEAADVVLVRGGERGIRVSGDSQTLVEALSNLITNAIAYSSAGSSVGIAARRQDDTVEIAVSDRGIGISEADQQRIFERFFRADQARSRRTGGTGLGLSIVKHAIQRHGGDVRLWSKPGKGSTFTIVLPALAEEEPAPRRKRVKTKDRRALRIAERTAAEHSDTITDSQPTINTDRNTAQKGDRR